MAVKSPTFEGLSVHHKDFLPLAPTKHIKSTAQKNVKVFSSEVICNRVVTGSSYCGIARVFHWVCVGDRFDHGSRQKKV